MISGRPVLNWSHPHPINPQQSSGHRGNAAHRSLEPRLAGLEPPHKAHSLSLHHLGKLNAAQSHKACFNLLLEFYTQVSNYLWTFPHKCPLAAPTQILKYTLRLLPFLLSLPHLVMSPHSLLLQRAPGSHLLPPSPTSPAPEDADAFTARLRSRCSPHPIA